RPRGSGSKWRDRNHRHKVSGQGRACQAAECRPGGCGFGESGSVPPSRKSRFVPGNLLVSAHGNERTCIHRGLSALRNKFSLSLAAFCWRVRGIPHSDERVRCFGACLRGSGRTEKQEKNDEGVAPEQGFPCF